MIVKVDGNGNVTSSVGARTLSSASAPKSINCGVSGFDCYGEVAPGAELTLTAKPAAGYAFKKWTGSCAGSDATCDVVASNAKTVTAVFSAKGTGNAVGASLRAPRLKVKWRASIGAGTLVVQGSTTAPARTRIDMRRPGGGPLATLQVPVGGGSFRQVLPLRQGALSGGAKVFPGGFVVALTGRAGKLKLPLQVQTIAIPAPAEGVVRRASKSTTEEGRALSKLPARAPEAWAVFRFETQPRLTKKLTVVWFKPDGVAPRADLEEQSAGRDELPAARVGPPERALGRAAQGRLEGRADPERPGRLTTLRRGVLAVAAALAALAALPERRRSVHRRGAATCPSSRARSSRTPMRCSSGRWFGASPRLLRRSRPLAYHTGSPVAWRSGSRGIWASSSRWQRPSEGRAGGLPSVVGGRYGLPLRLRERPWKPASGIAYDPELPQARASCRYPNRPAPGHRALLAAGAFGESRVATFDAGGRVLRYGQGSGIGAAPSPCVPVENACSRSSAVAAATTRSACGRLPSFSSSANVRSRDRSVLRRRVRQSERAPTCWPTSDGLVATGKVGVQLVRLPPRRDGGARA